MMNTLLKCISRVFLFACLQLVNAAHHFGQGDLQIAVAAAKVVDEGLGLLGILHFHPVAGSEAKALAMAMRCF